MNLNTLVARVSSAFPGLTIAQAELDDRGGDHWVLLVNREYVFRFPRRPDKNLPLEIAVLSALHDIAPVAVPHYEFIAPDISFAGYRFLHGVELTNKVFAALPSAAKNRVLNDVASLLKVLHGLQPSQIADDRHWRSLWTPHEYTRRGRSRLTALKQSFPALIAPIEEFYRVYERDEPRSSVVIHGDVVEDHLLLSTDHTMLAGIIDFGDVGLGDPAEDLKGFWAYGDVAATHAIGVICENRPEPELLERSKRAYLRYRIDRFVEKFLDGEVKIHMREARALQRSLCASITPHT